MSSLLTRLHVWFNSFLTFRVIPFSAKLGTAYPTAFSWWFLTKPFQGYSKDCGSRKKCLLVLDKTGLTGDLLEVFPPTNQEVYLITVPRDAIKSVAREFLPAYLTDVAYLTDDPKDDKAKRNYRDYLMKVWRCYRKLLKIDGVLVANYSFYAERELAAAVESHKVPFLALHKECVAPPIMWQGYEGNCRDEKGPFTGRAMTVYNSTWKEIMTRAKVIEKEKIESVGCPRMDVYHRFRSRDRTTNKRLVTLFSFLPTSGLPYIGGGEKEIPWPEEMLFNGDKWGWNDLARESHRAIIELACERPDLSFVIKIKVGRAYLNYIKSLFDFELPDNLEIVQGGEAENFILESAVITGFNSTTLFEGIAAGKPVIVPRFAEAAHEETACGILELGEAVQWAESKTIYKELLAKAADQDPDNTIQLSPHAVEVLEKYVGNGDGLAGQRMRKFILNWVN
jgi:hypothetical protein